jgi:ankyrin repeat protein
VLKTLIDAGAKVSGSNNEGVTALMFAAQDGLVNNARALLLAGAEVNVRDKNGKSALTYAEENRQTSVARLLRSFGAVAFGFDQEKEK